VYLRPRREVGTAGARRRPRGSPASPPGSAAHVLRQWPALDSRPVGQRRQQLTDRAAVRWQLQIRGHAGQRHEHEAALAQAWMGQLEAGLVTLLAADEEQIDIDPARS